MNFVSKMFFVIAFSFISSLVLGSNYNHTISGVISDTEKNGIPNVVVSDGYNITVSNDLGEYKLQGNDSAKFVFISVPSDYQIPHVGNIPHFYKNIKGYKENIVANFELQRLTKKDKHIVLTVMADPQSQIEEDMIRFTNEPFQDLEKLKSTYPKNVTFLGMTVGDNVWDAPFLYPDYVKAFQQLSFPYFQVIGNHDHDEKTIGNDYEASHNYENFLGPTYYSFNRGDCHFVALDNIIYNTRKKYEEKISQEQINWLKQDLSQISKDKLIIIGMHSPLYRRGKTRIMSEVDKLLPILDGYEVVFLSGHTHRMNFNQVSDKIVEYTFSPTMGNSWAGNINTNGCPNGYGVLEIKGNQLVNLYYKSTFQDKNYQMNVYPVGMVKEKEQSVVAHIWNYNTNWKIDVYENGKRKGTMKQFTGYDPIAYNFFIGPEKPTRKPKLEPVRTYSLFYYTPQKKGSVVKIVVTDEFGNKYTEQISNVQ